MRAGIYYRLFGLIRLRLGLRALAPMTRQLFSLERPDLQLNVTQPSIVSSHLLSSPNSYRAGTPSGLTPHRLIGLALALLVPAPRPIAGKTRNGPRGAIRREPACRAVLVEFQRPSAQRTAGRQLRLSQAAQCC